jgi:hypothetical protein
MSPETAILRKASTLGIFLWVEGGKLKYKADRPLAGEVLEQLKAHKAEVVASLTRTAKIPGWCSQICEHFHQTEIPDMPTVVWCCTEEDSKHWRRVRLDTMTECPRRRSI